MVQELRPAHSAEEPAEPTALCSAILPLAVVVVAVGLLRVRPMPPAREVLVAAEQEMQIQPGQRAQMQHKGTLVESAVQMPRRVTAVVEAVPAVPVAQVRVHRLLELLALVGSENNRPLPVRPPTTPAVVPADVGNPALWVLRVPEAVELEVIQIM